MRSGQPRGDDEPPTRRHLAGRADQALKSGDLAAARAALEELLAAGGEWDDLDLRPLYRYVDARNGGRAAHRVPVPDQTSPTTAERAIVTEDTSVRAHPMSVIGGMTPFLEHVERGLWLHRPPISVRRIHAATILQVRNTFLVKDADGITVADACSRGSAPLEDVFDLALRTKPVVSVEGRAVLIADGTDGANFCHWLTDQYTRLAVYEQAGVLPATLIVDTLDKPFHAMTVAAASDLISDTVSLRETPAVRVEELYVASNVGVDHKHPAHKASAWALEFLRSHIDAAPAADSPARVYISRSDAPTRRVRNEAELEAMLRAHGFEVVTLSGLGVDEQAALFAGADVIVAPHGAGLSHLAFSGPGTYVLELFPATYGTLTFASLCAANEHDYTAMICEAVAGLPDRPNTDDLLADVDAVAAWVGGLPDERGARADHDARRSRSD